MTDTAQNAVPDEVMKLARESVAAEVKPDLRWFYLSGKADDHAAIRAVARAIMERTAALQARLTEAQQAVRDFQCPRPINGRPDETLVGECVDAGECGCGGRVALAAHDASPAAQEPKPVALWDNDAVWARFYRDGKNLGDICAEFNCRIYDLSPWLTAPLTRAALAAQEPKPVAWHCVAPPEDRDIYTSEEAEYVTFSEGEADEAKAEYGFTVTPLYTTPPLAAQEPKPVAFTSERQLEEVRKVGGTGYIWGKQDEFMPVPLYTTPPLAAQEPKPVADDELKLLRAHNFELQKANAAYVDANTCLIRELDGLREMLAEATAQEPKPVAVKPPSYQQIKDAVQANIERMHKAGESHIMMARWLSADLHALYTTPPLEKEAGE